MYIYLVRRLLFMVPVLIGVTLAVFLMLHLAPGDPAVLLAGDRASPQVIERTRQDWGLDQPLPIQYTQFVQRVIKGDLGTSIIQRRPVMGLVEMAFPVTIELAVAALLLSILIGVPAGVISATRHGSLTDQFSLLFALIGVSVPSFWLGILLMYGFAVKLRWLPTSGYGSLSHLILPAIAAGMAGAALISRVTRSSMLDVLGQNYVQTARAKGLSERVVIYRHALKNASLPVVTALGLQAGYMLAANVILEMVFSRPGLGRLMIDGILRRDYPVVQGVLLFLAISVMVANLLADIVYTLLDPRIRLGR